MQKSMESQIKNILNYYLFAELLSLEQKEFKVNLKDSNLISADDFGKAIIECKATLKDTKQIDAFKVYIGVIKTKDFIEYLQDIDFLEKDEESFENLNLNKHLNDYIALGYFYITKNGHLIYSYKKAIRYLPILPIIRIFKKTKDMSKAIKEYVEKQNEIEQLDNNAFLDKWKINKDEPELCYVIDTSWVLSEKEDANELKNLKNCVLCITDQILSEIDSFKKSTNEKKAFKARKFRTIVDELTREAQKNQDGNLRDGMWYPSKDNKQILIKIPSYPDLDPLHYGVDSSPDASVVKATVDMTSKYFPILLSDDKSIRLGVQKFTSCFWQSKNLIKDIGISNRRLCELKSKNNIEALREEEEFFFKYFEIFELLEKIREALSSFGDYYFKGTSIAIEKLDSDNEDEPGYKKAIEDLENISTNQILEDIKDLLSREGSNLLNTYIYGRPLKFDLSSIKTTVELFVNQDIPLAKWLSSHNASLIQQIAINTANTLPKQDLMSVNGPPGTGKTTLLKDIIANIIVKRALKVIELSYNIISEKRKVNDKLKSFGIVIASNNNAAVENISVELPKIDNDIKTVLNDLGENNFRYFDDIIRKYFEQILSENKRKNEEDESEIDLEKIKESDYLGLLSIPLGRSENRTRAKDLLEVLKTDIDPESVPSNEEIERTGQNILNLKSKIEEYSKKHKDYYTTLLTLPDLHRQHQETKSHIQTLENSLSGLTEKIHDLEEDIARLENEKKEKIHLLDIHYKDKPSLCENILAIFIKSFKNKIEQWEKKKQDTILEINKLNENLDKKEREKEELKKDINSNKSEINELEQKIENIEREIKDKEDLLKTTELELGEMLLSKDLYLKAISGETLSDAEKEKIYKFTPYNHRELNNLRMKIFIESLKLHKLLILKYNDDFKYILNLFKGYLSRPDSFDNSKYTVEDLFNAFFFVIPVTSTTFDSFGTLFKLINMAGIGYLMIDEAGQAVPQKALMSLYKSNKAIIVGDPLQIEPVVNLTQRFDDYLIKSFNIQEPERYAVTKSSIQILADNSSVIGATYGNLRVGIPLNIHRRCNNPMFKISNKIAYENRMIKGQEDKWTIKDLVPDYLGKGPKSLWIDVNWNKSKKNNQVVLDEIKVLRKVLSDIEEKLKSNNKDIEEFVKNKNLFIITPFRFIDTYLNNKFKNSNSRLEKALADESLGKFIGTIHTFQGKEAKMVIIVLGGRSRNSMRWVASKPNMLNVALTRAKEYCFIIGDKEIWGTMNHFKDAVKMMEKVENIITQNTPPFF
jgi:superfamily I DNA and/or RNA helicase